MFIHYFIEKVKTQQLNVQIQDDPVMRIKMSKFYKLISHEIRKNNDKVDFIICLDLILIVIYIFNLSSVNIFKKKHSCEEFQGILNSFFKFPFY